jgi:hypothetical protein
MRPRILLVAVADWFGPTRLPRALKLAGFEVGILADPAGLLALSRHIEYRYEFDIINLRMGVLGPVVNAIVDFNPRLVIPCDEAAAHLLQNMALAWDGVRAPGGQFRLALPPLVREILLRSLGEARTFPVRTGRTLARRMASLLGIPAPPSEPVPYLQVAEAFARNNGWPVVLTYEGRTGGERVRICTTSDELRAGYSDLTQGTTLRPGVGCALRYVWHSIITGLHVVGDLTRSLTTGPQLAIEALPAGRPASYSAASYEGRWLGGVAAVSERIFPANSATSSAVRLVDDPAMTDAARKMVGRLGYTGFSGLDFIRDETSGQLWFLKFNPRPTALTHLGPLAGGDLCSALLAASTNHQPSPPKPFQETTVALYPQDWARDPTAGDRGTEHADLPIDDDRLTAALLASAQRQE